MGPIGPLELGIVLLVVLLIFGPKRLPGLGKQLGSGMREFKEGITGKSDSGDDQDDEEHRAQIAAATASTEPPAGTPAKDTQSSS